MISEPLMVYSELCVCVRVYACLSVSVRACAGRCREEGGQEEECERRYRLCESSL